MRITVQSSCECRCVCCCSIFVKVPFKEKRQIMKLVTHLFILGVLLALTTNIQAKKKHKHNKSSGSESKTKTNWSSSTSNGDSNIMLATEEHGYYVKRTFEPLNTSSQIAPPTLPSPPYLAIPIAWFSCDADCVNRNSVTLNGNSNALQEGFLCDDDCVESYEPVCGRSPYEVAVFYNKCKLNVAKCRTHGLWTEIDYEECKRLYAKEVEYTHKKFRSSPYFRHTSTASSNKETDSQKNREFQTVINDTTEIGDKLRDGADIETETENLIEGSGSSTESTTTS